MAATSRGSRSAARALRAEPGPSRQSAVTEIVRLTMEASQEVETPDDLAQVLVSVIMQQADKDMETFREVCGLTPEELADAAKRARAFQVTKAQNKVEEEG